LPFPSPISCPFDGLRDLGNGLDGSLQSFNHTAEFLNWRAEWWHEDHDVADRAEQEPSAACVHRHFVTDPLFERIGFLRLSILHQLDRHDESLLPDLSHMGQLPERLKQSRHRLNLGLQSGERLFFLEHLDVGQGDGAAERIAGVTVAVEEGFEVCVSAEKGLVDLIACEGCGQRHVAAGQSFADRHQIRCDSLMLAGEHLAGSAESGGDFIDNQEDVVLGAEFTHPLQIARRRGEHSRCGLHEWLDDEAGHFTVPVLEDLLNRVKAGHLAGREGQTKWATIAIGRVCFGGGEEQRLESPVEEINIAHADCPDGIAVIGQLQMKKCVLGSGLRAS